MINDRVPGRQKDINARILKAAKELLAGRLGVIAASRELSPLRHEAEPRVAEILLTFTGIDSQTDALPIGAVREHWDRKALECKDKEIAHVEEFYKKDALEAATELIRLLEIPS